MSDDIVCAPTRKPGKVKELKCASLAIGLDIIIDKTRTVNPENQYLKTDEQTTKLPTNTSTSAVRSN